MRFLAPIALLASALCCVACNNAKADAQQGTDPEELIEREVIVEDIKEGEGEPVREAYRVMIEYSGKTVGGDQPFDRNDKRDADGNPTKTPYAVRIGTGGSITGLEEGLVGMKKGGVRKMTIPWQKGYGKDGSPDGAIPPKADLEFTVTLLDFVSPDDEEAFDYEDIKVGTGPVVDEGDKITVHYRCTYTNGMVFDDSRKRGDEAAGGTPFVFKVARKEVIQGLDYGVRGMREGGIRKIWMAPMLVFGDFGYDVIASGQIVLVDVELLKVEKG